MEQDAYEGFLTTCKTDISMRGAYVQTSQEEILRAIETTRRELFFSKIIHEHLHQQEINTQRRKIDQLEKEIQELKQAASPIHEVVLLKRITKTEARTMILNLFKSGIVFHYSDIVKKTNIDLRTVVNICNELESAGKLIYAK